MKRHDFSGKNVVITGASRGIGRALAREFARRGANLLLSSLPGEKGELDGVVDELKNAHHTAVDTLVVDLTDPDGPKRLHQKAGEMPGEVYALVNNAGTVGYGNFWEIDWDIHRRTMLVNLLVPARLMHLFLPDMIERGTGVICNIGSVSAFQSDPFFSVYGATKAAIVSLSSGVKEELADTGVTLSVINPPFVDTALLKVSGFPRRLPWYRLGGGLKTPEWVAGKTVCALERGKTFYMLGLWSRFIHLVMIPISPRWLVNFLSRFLLRGSRNAGTY